jgi:hypothetical protein
LLLLFRSHGRIVAWAAAAAQLGHLFLLQQEADPIKAQYVHSRGDPWRWKHLSFCLTERWNKCLNGTLAKRWKIILYSCKRGFFIRLAPSQQRSTEGELFKVQRRINLLSRPRKRFRANLPLKQVSASPAPFLIWAEKFRHQGDQIGRIFAHWVIVYFGLFF